MSASGRTLPFRIFPANGWVGWIVLKKSGTEGPSAIFESEGLLQHRFIAIARAITNHSFVRSSASDFFNKIGGKQPLTRRLADRLYLLLDLFVRWDRLGHAVSAAASASCSL